MAKTEFVYTTYIKTTPQKVWRAITDPEFSRQYWVHGIVSDWKQGSRWQHLVDGDASKCTVAGEIVESDPPRRLVITWADPSDAADRADPSRVTFEIEPVEDMVRLNVIHGNLRVGSIMTRKIQTGWPRVLSSMKSLLETGTALNTWAGQTEVSAQAASLRV